MRIHTVYEDASGESHFRDIEVDWVCSRLLAPRLRWAHDVTGDADDAVLLAEQIKRCRLSA